MNIADFPSIDDLVGIPLGIFVSLAENDCWYAGSARDFMVEWLHSMFLKDNAASSKEI